MPHDLSCRRARKGAKQLKAADLNVFWTPFVQEIEHVFSRLPLPVFRGNDGYDKDSVRSITCANDAGVLDD